MNVYAHEPEYFDTTPIEKQRICCNCRHRKQPIINRCEIDGHYISYIACLTAWCRHWASDKEDWEARSDDA